MVRIVHVTTDWFQTGKGVHQVCMLSLCLFHLNAEYIMQNAELDEAQAGIKTSGRNKLSLQSHKLGNSIHRKKNQSFYK